MSSLSLEGKLKPQWTMPVHSHFWEGGETFNSNQGMIFKKHFYKMKYILKDKLKAASKK